MDSGHLPCQHWTSLQQRLVIEKYGLMYDLWSIQHNAVIVHKVVTYSARFQITDSYLVSCSAVLQRGET